LFVSVQTSQYFWNVVLNNLKQGTSNHCTTWGVCDGKMIRCSPTLLVVWTSSILTWELWQSRINKCLFSKDMLPPHACIVVMKWEIHVENKHAIIHACGYITIIQPLSHCSL
jgi:hypothetical protein